jgi:hypothetical protein
VLGQTTQTLTGQAEAVAWICFVVGLILVSAGTAIGFYLTLFGPKKKVEEKTETVREQVDALEAQAASPQAAPEAVATAEAAKKTLDEIKGIIAALPENLRFAGLLILVGAVLMSVGTVQFGGISLF